MIYENTMCLKLYRALIEEDTSFKLAASLNIDKDIKAPDYPADAYF